MTNDSLLRFFISIGWCPFLLYFKPIINKYRLQNSSALHEWIEVSSTIIVYLLYLTMETVRLCYDRILSLPNYKRFSLKMGTDEILNCQSWKHIFIEVWIFGKFYKWNWYWFTMQDFYNTHIQHSIHKQDKYSTCERSHNPDETKRVHFCSKDAKYWHKTNISCMVNRDKEILPIEY